MGHFAVVRDAYEVDDWELVAQLLKQALGMHLVAATRQARNSPGFLAEELDRGAAEQLQRACEARAMPTHLVAQEEVVILPRALRVHSLWVAEDALWICRSPTSPKEPIRWDSVALIAACQTMKKESFHRWSADFNPVNDVSELKVQKYSQDFIEHVADLFGMAADGGLLRGRLGSRELNYKQALGVDRADPRLDTGKRFASFRLVLSRIFTKAARAQMPPEPIALLGGRLKPNCRLHNLTSLKEFDAYNRWLLQRIRIGSR